MNNENMSNGSKADCFAFRDLNGKGECVALNDLYCKNGERCSFYKKKEKVENDQSRRKTLV